jgi:hypothetical protein
MLTSQIQRAMREATRGGARKLSVQPMSAMLHLNVYHCLSAENVQSRINLFIDKVFEKLYKFKVFLNLNQIALPKSVGIV